MGLFKKKQNLASEKLMQLGIGLDSIKHEDYSPEEITLDDELAGKIKISYSPSVNFWKFDTILLTDYKDGKRILLFAKNNSVERDIKDLANELYKIFGNDWLERKELELYELNIYRNSNEDFSTIRYWKNFDDYTVELNGSVKTSQITFVLRGK
jgi:hypothetical protein